MATIKQNLDAIKLALNDVDAKPDLLKKDKFYDDLKADIKPRKEALAAALLNYVPSDITEISGVVKDENGKNIAKVVDGVVVLLP